MGLFVGWMVWVENILLDGCCCVVVVVVAFRHVFVCVCEYICVLLVWYRAYGGQFLIHISNIWIYVMSCVGPAGWSSTWLAGHPSSMAKT